MSEKSGVGIRFFSQLERGKETLSKFVKNIQTVLLKAQRHILLIDFDIN
jgi:hypothetical protein